MTKSIEDIFTEHPETFKRYYNTPGFCEYITKEFPTYFNNTTKNHSQTFIEYQYRSYMAGRNSI